MMAEGHFHFAEHLFCWCGYPITVEDVPTVEGERQVYSDGKTGAIIEECPKCGDCPLEVRWLFEVPEPTWSMAFEKVEGETT